MFLKDSNLVVQRIIDNERGFAIWNWREKYSAYYLRFQRVFNAILSSTNTQAVVYHRSTILSERIDSTITGFDDLWSRQGQGF